MIEVQLIGGYNTRAFHVADGHWVDTIGYDLMVLSEDRRDRKYELGADMTKRWVRVVGGISMAPVITEQADMIPRGCVGHIAGD